MLCSEHAGGAHEIVAVRGRSHAEVVEAAGDGMTERVERVPDRHVARRQRLDLVRRVQREGDAEIADFIIQYTQFPLIRDIL